MREDFSRAVETKKGITISDYACLYMLAERERFELSVPVLPVHTISNRAPSAGLGHLSALRRIFYRKLFWLASKKHEKRTFFIVYRGVVKVLWGTVGCAYALSKGCGGCCLKDTLHAMRVVKGSSQPSMMSNCVEAAYSLKTYGAFSKKKRHKHFCLRLLGVGHPLTTATAAISRS